MVLALLRVVSDLATVCTPAQGEVLRTHVEVLLDDVRRDVTQSADGDPLLERGTRLMAHLRT